MLTVILPMAVGTAVLLVICQIITVNLLFGCRFHCILACFLACVMYPQPQVAEYVPSDLPVLSTATILEAIPALLEQHDRYDQIRLTEYLAQVFPEIPEVLRGPVVIAATAGARQAALMHGICEKNTLSEDPHKRRFSAEAASSLSFWALGLRAPHRSVVEVPRASVSTPSAECCMCTSTMAPERMSVSSLVTSAQPPPMHSRAATPLVSPPAEYLPGWVTESVSVGSQVTSPQ